MAPWVITILAAVGIVALMIAGLGIKILVQKHGEFKRHCSSMDPYTGERTGCVCGQKAGQHSCHDQYHPLEVNEEMMEEL